LHLVVPLRSASAFKFLSGGIFEALVVIASARPTFQLSVVSNSATLVPLLAQCSTPNIINYSLISTWLGRDCCKLVASRRTWTFSIGQYPVDMHTLGVSSCSLASAARTKAATRFSQSVAKVLNSGESRHRVCLAIMQTNVTNDHPRALKHLMEAGMR